MNAYEEIRLRTCIRIAEISRELERAKAGRPSEISADACTNSKEQQLEDAGIPKRTAYDYEELSGGKDEQV
jgi:hypothetical protein